MCDGGASSAREARTASQPTRTVIQLKSLSVAERAIAARTSVLTCPSTKMEGDDDGGPQPRSCNLRGGERCDRDQILRAPRLPEATRRDDRWWSACAIHGHAGYEGSAHHACTRRRRASLRDPVARVRSDAAERPW